MRQLHLRFDNKNQAQGILQTCPEIKAHIELGIIYNDDGVINEQTGEVITPATPKIGYHVDIVIEKNCTTLDVYDAKPVSPVHSFAGF